MAIHSCDDDKVKSENQTAVPNFGQSLIYEVRLEGHLDPRWTDWLEGLAITLQANGDTILSGPVVDQAALYGLLRKVRDLGMPLISLNRADPGRADTPDAKG